MPAMTNWENHRRQSQQSRLELGLGVSRGSTKCPDFADLQPNPRSGLSYQTRVVTIELKERIKK